MKTLLLDGNSLAYRAFYGVPADMATASGQVTNAVFGFTSMLINLLRDHRPVRMCVCFDRPEPTFRHQAIPEYKAGRQETPPILREQFGLIRQVIETLGITIVELPGFEADDCLATLAQRCVAQGDEVIVVTGDRDTYQLVSDPFVRVLYNRRGVSDYLLLDERGVEDKTGVKPRDYVLYAALRGDVSDNLAGVPGVGEKTAAKLVNTYGSAEAIIAGAPDQTPKLAKNIADSAEIIRRNVDAMTLVQNAPLEVDLAELAITPWQAGEVQSLFGLLEFRSLYARLAEVAAKAPEGGLGGSVLEPDQSAVSFELAKGEPRHVVAVEGLAELSAILTSAGQPEAESCAVVLAAWDGPAGRSALSGLVIKPKGGQTSFVDPKLLQNPEAIEALAQLFKGQRVITHSAKELMRSLWGLGIEASNPTPFYLELDAAIAGYLADSAAQRYHISDLTQRYLGADLQLSGADKNGQLDLLAADNLPRDLALQAHALEQLAPKLSDAIEQLGNTALLVEIEQPLISVLAHMEQLGIGVDTDRLHDLAARLTSEANQLETSIQELAGMQFNVNSTQQLRGVLFDKLGLSPGKKTKTGYSTDAQTLEKIRDQHPIVERLLRYRELEKLRSTYGESLLQEVDTDGRIHATFNQTVARTGRLSSEAPNLHNIPVRSDEGIEFRKCFVPAHSMDFLIADYNQIELRVIAHLSDDPGLVEAFTQGRDIHTSTAAAIFGVDAQDVTTAMRSKAKMVSYGLAYGMESYGLSQRLGIPVGEAAEILGAYFSAFPKVRSLMDKSVADAKAKGYTETLFGRRRRIPELVSSNPRVRQAGERQAMNAGIQGLAADIFKVAMVRVDRRLRDTNSPARLVLQVHDELILEVPPTDREATQALVVTEMSNAAALSVPLEVNVGWGSSWAEAK